ncbi:MAG TPA: LysR family transcriptional regulator [Alphaproteobacteria bacterium]|nr:LysR family transcriptional regulator [Alphaproteobacteria bacterium]
MLTLRQIEVIRAVMVTGTIAGAARLLNVAAPGVSRLMKHTEDTLGLKLFTRRGGRYEPTPQARTLFDQMNEVYRNLENLRYAIGNVARGQSSELKLGSVPSIANVMVPLAVADVRKRYPDLLVDIDILKLEDSIDYLLLGRGEVVAMSYKLDHPALTFEPLATGELYCIVAEGHALARRKSISIREIAAHKLIGIEPKDPYGRIMVGLFEEAGVDYRIAIKARFGTTVCGLVRNDLGIAIIDGFTVAHGSMPGIRVIPISEPTSFQTFVAYRRDATLTTAAEFFIRSLRQRMKALATRPRAAA